VLVAVWEQQAYLSLSPSNVNLSKGVDALDEHLLIQKYFSNIGSAYLAEHNVETSVGDDASVITSKKNTHLINSIDTSIENIHFLDSMSSQDIAYRSCVVALSDLAACGARPNWYSVALTFPKLDESWIKGFSTGLQKFSDEFKIPLIGGDTTKGPLSVTIQVMGEVGIKKTLLRSNAKEDQLIFVSGIIGDAYLGLKELMQSTNSNLNTSAYLYPKAQIELGLELVGVASAAIDISDGLLQDLSLICKSSGVGAEIYFEDIPTSIEDKSLELINSGDDYQICFTAFKSSVRKIEEISHKLSIPITLIGKTTSSRELVLYDESHDKMELGRGYKNF